MKIKNPFFKKNNNINLSDICKILGVKRPKKDLKINNISDLESSSKYDISFYNNSNYLDLLKKSKVKYVISNEKYFKSIKNYCHPILVKNVLKSVYEIINIFYPEALNDAIDFDLSTPNKKKNKIKFGKNVLFGKNVKIGNNTKIGHNTIIESNVIIGSNCVIGNNVLIKNTIIGKNVRVMDGAIIGKKVLVFILIKK